MPSSKESNNGSKTTTFKENDTIEIPIIFSPKLPNPGSFSIPYIVRKVEIERGLCDLGASVSIKPYSLFHKLHRGSLLAVPFSLQLANGSMTQHRQVRRCACQYRRHLGIRRLHYSRYA